MFRFATCLDYFLIFMGSIGALAVGGGLPAFAFIWGQMTDSFSTPGQEMVDAARQTMYYFFYLGAGIFAAGWLMYGCWMIAG